MAAAAAGRLDGWLGTAEGALALVILLDQFPRNVFRGTPRAYATDPQARAAAEAALAAGHDRALGAPFCWFFYLPFEHAEDLASQDRCVALFEALPDDEDKAMVCRAAYRHREIIARFGRFPHRNEVLGRESTPAERRAVEAGFAW